jgi:hypothetical protein
MRKELHLVGCLRSVASSVWQTRMSGWPPRFIPKKWPSPLLLQNCPSDAKHIKRNSSMQLHIKPPTFVSTSLADKRLQVPSYGHLQELLANTLTDRRRCSPFEFSDVRRRPFSLSLSPQSPRTPALMPSIGRRWSKPGKWRGFHVCPNCKNERGFCFFSG